MTLSVWPLLSSSWGSWVSLSAIIPKQMTTISSQSFKAQTSENLNKQMSMYLEAIYLTQHMFRNILKQIHINLPNFVL